MLILLLGQLSFQDKTRNRINYIFLVQNSLSLLYHFKIKQQSESLHSLFRYKRLFKDKHQSLAWKNGLKYLLLIALSIPKVPLRLEYAFGVYLAVANRRDSSEAGKASFGKHEDRCLEAAQVALSAQINRWFPIGIVEEQWFLSFCLHCLKCRSIELIFRCSGLHVYVIPQNLYF